MARFRVPAILAVFLVTSPAEGAPEPLPDCTDPALPTTSLPNGYPFDLHRIIALYRFHRQTDALRQLDAARALARGPWRRRFPSEVVTRLDTLRDCLTTTAPPPLARLAVRVVGQQYEHQARMAPRPGARVHVEGILLGRTGSNGTLIARVPSGRLYVEAEDPITEWGSSDVNLSPGESKSIAIVLSDGKGVSERTKLVLAQTVDDILPATSGSLTLRFMRDGDLAPVTQIVSFDVIGVEGNLEVDFREHFTVVRGEMVAVDARRVFDALAPYSERIVLLAVEAMSSPEEMHYGRVAFRVGLSPMTVTLAPPPSRPHLSVSNVAVGVSTFDGIAVERVSDANGRVHVESFPHGTVALECVVESDGKYYYGHATVTHSGPRSVTLVLRHVEDLKNGVPPTR